MKDTNAILDELNAMCRILSIGHPPTLIPDNDTKIGKYRHDRQEIGINEVEIRKLSENGCAGLLVHELGHHEITRGHLFRTDKWHLYHHVLTNALEDCRVDAWMTQRFIGVHDWYHALHQSGNWDQPIAKNQPLASVFASACKGEYVRGWAPYTDLDPIVSQALEKTRYARIDYCSSIPPIRPSDIQDIKTTDERYRADVLSNLKHMQDAADEPWEEVVQMAALDAFRLANNQIFPEAMRLMALDKEILNTWFQYQPNTITLVKKIIKTLSWREALLLYQLASKLFNKTGKPAKVKDGMAMADGILAMIFVQREYQFEKVLMRNVTWKPHLRNYDAIAAKLLPQTNQLIETIRQILARRQPKLQTGHRCGPKLDMRRAMQFEVNPGLFDRVWCRWEYQEPEKAAFLLLIDLSGSMSGGKIDAAVDAAVLLIETLLALDMPMAVYGFQDVLIPFVEFGQPVDENTRWTIAQMPLEVAGKRPSGNNQLGFNDDGPCLEEAGLELKKRPESKKILIVISDGSPAGKNSDDNDLRRVVHEIQQDGEIHLFGIGIGPKTDHVKKFYRNCKAEVPINMMAFEIGTLILTHAVGHD